MMNVSSLKAKLQRKLYPLLTIILMVLVMLCYNIEVLLGQTAINRNVLITSNTDVGGTLSKSSGTFVIDHPLDPENKLLFHSFVESPEPKNIYDGVATLDAKGEAIIKLPKYYEALNIDYRYQYTGIGAPMPNLHIKSKIKDNTFVIGGGVPGGLVTWQVTGNRNDPFIQKNPIINEVEKGPGQPVDKGEFLFSGYKEIYGTEPQ